MKGVIILAGLLAGASAAAEEPAALPGGRRVSLEELAPTPPSPWPTTALVRARMAPRDGIRERAGSLVVTTTCGKRSCVDGLIDGKRELIGARTTRDEKEVLKAPGGTVERVIKLAHSDEHHVSVYLGATHYSGGAHSYNHLACASFSRPDGRRLRLLDVMPRNTIGALILRARQVLSDLGNTGFTIDEKSFLVLQAGIVLCAVTDSVYAGTIIEIGKTTVPGEH